MTRLAPSRGVSYLTYEEWRLIDYLAKAGHGPWVRRGAARTDLHYTPQSNNLNVILHRIRRKLGYDAIEGNGNTWIRLGEAGWEALAKFPAGPS